MALVPFLIDAFQNPVFLISAVLTALGIGLSQGIILGCAILIRFPSLQNHAKTVSLSLFTLFLINAILSVPRFASPEKINLSSLSESSSQDFASTLF